MQEDDKLHGANKEFTEEDRCQPAPSLYTLLWTGCHFGSFAVWLPQLYFNGFIHPPLYLPAILSSIQPSVPHDLSSTSSSFMETVLLISMTKKFKTLSSVSVHLQPRNDGNLTACGFSRHRWEKDFKTNALFWRITVNSAQAQTVKIRESAAYVT